MRLDEAIIAGIRPAAQWRGGLVSDLRCPHCDHISSYAPRQMSRRMAQ
jgi:hypothetical protein